MEPDEQAHALTHRLFQLGARLLLHNMPHVLTAAAQGMAVPQDHSLATHAAKVEGVSRQQSMSDNVVLWCKFGDTEMLHRLDLRCRISRLYIVMMPVGKQWLPRG